MRAFRFKVKNNDDWALTDLEVVIIANNVEHCLEILNGKGYYHVTEEDLIELEEGFHVIQDMKIM